jgi:hypothetical protein
VGKRQWNATPINYNKRDSFVVINTTIEAWLLSSCLKEIPMIMWSLIPLINLTNKRYDYNTFNSLHVNQSLGGMKSALKNSQLNAAYEV